LIKEEEKRKEKETGDCLTAGGRSSVLKGIAGEKPPSGVWQCPERANHGQGRPISCAVHQPNGPGHYTNHHQDSPHTQQRRAYSSIGKDVFIRYYRRDL
jgi:hypothetical protein